MKKGYHWRCNIHTDNQDAHRSCTSTSGCMPILPDVQFGLKGFLTPAPLACTSSQHTGKMAVVSRGQPCSHLLNGGTSMLYCQNLELHILTALNKLWLPSASFQLKLVQYKLAVLMSNDASMSLHRWAAHQAMTGSEVAYFAYRR